jgi:hypothetical protein
MTKADKGGYTVGYGRPPRHTPGTKRDAQISPSRLPKVYPKV